MAEIVRDRNSDGAYGLSTACFVLAAVTSPLVGAGLPLAALPLGLMGVGVVGVFVPRIPVAPAVAAASGAARGVGRAWQAAGMGPRIETSLARGRAAGAALASRSGRRLSALGTQALETARQARSEWGPTSPVRAMALVRVTRGQRRV